MSLTTAQVRHIATDHLQQLAMLSKQIDSGGRVVGRLRMAGNSGAMVYIAGNGGSVATAAHLVNDLGKATKRLGGAPIWVMSLNGNMPWLTALANDEGYEPFFSRQLETFASTGDVLVVISASGNSPNVVCAVRLAKERGVVTIALLGFDRSVLKNLVGEYVWTLTKESAYELAEDCHMILCHILTMCLMQDRHIISDVS